MTMYTVKEMVELAFKKYKVSEYSSKDSCKKKIYEYIHANSLEPIGRKTTPGSKKPAGAYDLRTKDEIIEFGLSEFLIKNTKNRATKSLKYYEEKAREENGLREDRVLEFLNGTSEQQLMDSEEKRLGIRKITKYSREFYELKKFFMLEALFSKYYSFKSDELVEDMNEENRIDAINSEEYNVTDIILKEKIREWENYVEKIDADKTNAD